MAYQTNRNYGYCMKLVMKGFSWSRFLDLFRRQKKVMVESKVEVLEVDGHQTPMGSRLTIPVKTHTTMPAHVVLMVGGKSYCVFGKDLIKAVKNVIEP